MNLYNLIDWLRPIRCRERNSITKNAYGNCLEYGSGREPYRNVLRNRVEHYVSCDWSEESKSVKTSTGREMKALSGQFDSIVCTDVIQHISNPSACLDELYDLLKPGGVLCLSSVFFFPVCDLKDYWRFSKEGMVELCQRSGFHIQNVDQRAGALCTTLLVLQHFFQRAFGGPYTGWRSKRGFMRRLMVLVIELLFMIPAWVAYFLDKIIPSYDLTIGYVVVAKKC